MVALINIFAFTIFLILMMPSVVVDIRKRIIPNWVIFSTVFLWICWQIALFIVDEKPPSLENAIGAVVVLVALVVFVNICERICKKYLFGGGDMKLIACTTLFLGVYGMMIALFFACIISLIYAIPKLRNGIPFAPCMFCGALISLMA